MVDEAVGAAEDVDAALLVVTPPESSRAVKIATEERRILDLVKAARKPVVLAINKVDTVKDKPTLFPILTAWHELRHVRGAGPRVGAQGLGRGLGLVSELAQAAARGSADLFGRTCSPIAPSGFWPAS